MDVFQGWLKNVSDPSELSNAVTDIFQKIEGLPAMDRNRVYDQLKSNSQFTQHVNQIQPQTA